MSDFADPTQLNQTQALPPHRFSWRPKLNKERTRTEGREVYEDAPWLDVQVDSQTAISTYATPADLKTYSASYKRFLEDSKSEGIIGTRLEQWAPMGRSVVEEYRFLKIRTVEELANIPDADLPRYPMGREWSGQAKAWLKAAKDGAPVAKIAREYEDLKARFAELEKQNKQVMKELERATAPESKGKG